MTDDFIDVAIDFETYFDKDYTLKKLTNYEYVMDPKFEILGVSMIFNGLPPVWVIGRFEDVYSQLKKIPWDRCRAIAHNARFEASILEWRLGIRPAAYMCTMVGSRPHLVPYAGGQSLDALLEYTKLGKKGTFINEAQGKRLTDFTPAQLAEFKDYCCNDTAGSYRLWCHLRGILPVDELETIDRTIKKYVRPTLTLKREALDLRLKDIVDESMKRVDKLQNDYGVTIADIRSRTKFAIHLEKALNSGRGLGFSRGASVPIKTSKRTGKPTFAFAKDDLEFKALLGHPVEKVRDLVSAKLFFASTLEESRIERLIEMHRLLNGFLAVPLIYYGAHTGRFSGDESINLQNLPRVEFADGTQTTLRKGHLRFCIEAQPGYSIISADLSNIEARIVATLSGQTDLVEGFRRGEDIYANFASTCYGLVVTKATHPKERFVGKTCILGLGYGMGWRKFHLKMAQEGIVMSEQEAQRIVYLYRNTYDKVPALWTDLNYAANKFMTDPAGMYPWRGLIFAHERIVLPNGMPIVYPGIMSNGSGLSFRSRFGKAIAAAVHTGIDGPGANQTYLWGGALTENVCSALAQIIIKNAELKLARLGVHTALQVHDELVFHVPTVLVDRVTPMIAKVMTEVVPFLPQLPVAVEISHGQNYGACKK